MAGRATIHLMVGPAMTRSLAVPGTDTLLGGVGNDVFTYTFGDGVDSVDGGDDLDTLNIMGTATANTLDVIWDGAHLTNFEGGTLTSVETVVDLGAARIR